MVVQHAALVCEGPGMHVEKGVTGRYAITLTPDHDEISSKGKLDGWPFPGSGGDGRIGVCVWLVQVHLSPRSLPSLECVEAVGHGDLVE